ASFPVSHDLATLVHRIGRRGVAPSPGSVVPSCRGGAPAPGSDVVHPLERPWGTDRRMRAFVKPTVPTPYEELKTQEQVEAIMQPGSGAVEIDLLSDTLGRNAGHVQA